MKIKDIQIKVNGKWKKVSKIKDIQDCEAVMFTEIMTQSEFKKHFKDLI